MPRRIAKQPLLYLSFVQCYLEPGSTYQFSHHFQGVLANRLSRTMRASQELIDQFPGVQKVSFWISAGKILPKKTVRIQLHNKRKHELELFVVIPYSWTRRPKLERHQRAVSSLINTIATFFEGFQIDTNEFRSREGPLLVELASNTDRYFDDWSLN
jgi:hypothetical protein